VPTIPLNWKKGLAIFLVALAGAFWLARFSHDRHPLQSTEIKLASAEPERTPQRDATPHKRPWDGVRSRTIAGPPVFPPKPAPQILHVEWRGTWYPAEILSSSGSSNLIRYVGYGPEWDEWVTSERMRFVPPDAIPTEMAINSDEAAFESGGGIFQPAATLPQPTNDFVVHGSPAKGDPLVQWGGQWWPAEILQAQENGYFIHYKGYGPEWDEWITSERLGIYEGDDP